MKRRYKEGQCRGQGELFPERMDDYVGANHPIRVLDRYVEACNLEKLGFKNTSQNETNRGQPAYPPAALLKLYLYGYVNQFRSSRRLEKECQRNLEVMWLMQGLKPSYRTIANFRSENPRALRQVHKEFIIFCKTLDLFEEVSVAIDGSFFKANASRASFKTKKGLKKEQKKLEQYVRQWQKVTTSTDKREDELKGQASQQSIEQALERLEEIDELVQEWDEIEDEEKEVERSTTDKDAKKLSKSGQSCVGYNVQIAVDGKRDIILDAEPTSDNNDSQQLYPMASKAKQTLEVERLEVVHFYALFAVFWQQWVVCAQLLDEAAVTWHAGVRCNNAVEWTFLRAAAGQTNFHSHGVNLLKWREQCLGTVIPGVSCDVG